MKGIGKTENHGQFFIISTIVVAFTLVGIQFLFAGYNLADASVPFTLQEDYLFSNLKDSFVRAYVVGQCPVLKSNLDEIKADAERTVQQRRMLLNVTYTQPCAGMAKQDTTFTVNLTSFNYVLYDEFTLAP
ncbi:MAG: hypothetical protein HY366_01995 [Candidatus Aenigmarchaeota archaeon]|nr:hypothetical protein [Candidatus Aenigmarchaeota archaeon]